MASMTVGTGRPTGRSATSGAPRPLRSDARRNQERILHAARAVFAEQGLDAPLDDVARRAGIGIGTLYRRFPARQDLIEAVVVAKADEYLDAARAALQADDAWSGFCDYLERVFELQSSDQTVADLLTRTIPDCPQILALRAQIDDAQNAVIRRAIDAGALRADFTGEDLLVLLLANRGVVHGAGVEACTAWRRFFALVLDALRA